MNTTIYYNQNTKPKRVNSEEQFNKVISENKPIEEKILNNNKNTTLDKIFSTLETYSFTMFTFILGLFSAWSWQLLPHHIIDLFDHNRKSQVIVLFCLVLFTLDFFNPETTFDMIMLKSTIIFFSYLLITKQSLSMFVLTNIMFMILAFLHNSVKRYELLIEKETNLQNKNTMINKKNIFKMLSKITIVLLVLIVTYGTVTYFIKQYKDHYKKDGNLGRFLLKYIFEGSIAQQKETGNVIDF